MDYTDGDEGSCHLARTSAHPIPQRVCSNTSPFQALSPALADAPLTKRAAEDPDRRKTRFFHPEERRCAGHTPDGACHMTTIKSDDQIPAESMVDPGAAETAHAYAHLKGSSLPKGVASVWNEAQMLYRLLRQEYSGSGPEVSNFDTAWNVWTDNRPHPADPEGLIYANRALLFYKRAHTTATAKHAETQTASERLAASRAALATLWEIGADMARLASTIEATRPASSNPASEAPAVTPERLQAYLDEVETALSKIMADIKTIRSTASER